MEQLIFVIAMIIMAVTPFTFLAGLIQVFSTKSRQNGIKLLVFSIIGFIVGFGMCCSNV